MSPISEHGGPTCGFPFPGFRLPISLQLCFISALLLFVFTVMFTIEIENAAEHIFEPAHDKTEKKNCTCD